MNKFVILGMAGMALAFASACNSEKNSHQSSRKLPGTWQASPIVVDGRRNDWPVPYPYDNSKAMITYAISNDKDNLYITLETGDPATELKILRRGLVVWIDKSASQTQNTSVCYPSDNEHGQTKAVAARDMSKQIEEAINTTDEFFLNGFKGCRGKFKIEQGDTCGIKVGIGLDEYNQLVWEAVIPFRTFYPKAEIDRRDMGRPIDICFDILGMDRPAGMAGGDNGSPHFGVGMGGFGMMGPGMGMGMGGGMGRRGGGGNNGNDQLYKTTSTWQQVGIAWQDSVSTGK